MVAIETSFCRSDYFSGVWLPPRGGHRRSNLARHHLCEVLGTLLPGASVNRLSIPLSTRLLLLVATRITHLRDVSILTKPYAVLIVGASVRLPTKEVVDMRHHNRILPYLRPFGRLSAMLAGTIVFVGVLAAIVVGPATVIYWMKNLLIPLMVILVVVVGTIGLSVREGGKVLDSKDEPPSTSPGQSPRGNGLSEPVYWLLVTLFLLASAAMTCFFWLVIRDQWINARLLVAGRFDDGETLRIVFALLACVAVASGLLWRHYRTIDSYGSALEPFFMVVFTLCAALAAVVVLPAIFAG